MEEVRKMKCFEEYLECIPYDKIKYENYLKTQCCPATIKIEYDTKYLNAADFVLFNQRCNNLTLNVDLSSDLISVYKLFTYNKIELNASSIELYNNTVRVWFGRDCYCECELKNASGREFVHLKATAAFSKLIWKTTLFTQKPYDFKYISNFEMFKDSYWFLVKMYNILSGKTVEEMTDIKSLKANANNKNANEDNKNNNEPVEVKAHAGTEKCQLCGQLVDHLTYCQIKDSMGIRYRNICDSCMSKPGVTIAKK